MTQGQPLLTEKYQDAIKEEREKNVVNIGFCLLRPRTAHKIWSLWQAKNKKYILLNIIISVSSRYFFCLVLSFHIWILDTLWGTLGSQLLYVILNFEPIYRYFIHLNLLFWGRNYMLGVGHPFSLLYIYVYPNK